MEANKLIRYSIVIPVYNRQQNLACVLMALAKQTFSSEFWEIIIADESTISAVQIAGKYSEILNIKYFWQVGKTGNPGLAKNLASNLAIGESLIFVDSDVILNYKALEVYDRLHNLYPESIICGRYDFLIPMDVREEDIANRFDKVVSNQLPQVAPVTAGPIPGMDPRFQDKRTLEWDKPASLSLSGKPFSLGMFGGNLLIPRKLFIDSGRFDLNIQGHGGEDCCLGWELFSMGAECMFTEETIGWHLWHPRNQEQNEKDVKKNIVYIENKYHDLHIKYGIIASPEKNMIYANNGTFVTPKKQKELGIKDV